MPRGKQFLIHKWEFPFQKLTIWWKKAQQNQCLQVSIQGLDCVSHKHYWAWNMHRNMHSRNPRVGTRVGVWWVCAAYWGLQELTPFYRGFAIEVIPHSKKEQFFEYLIPWLKSPMIFWSFQAFAILHRVLENGLNMTPIQDHGPNNKTPLGGTYPYSYCATPRK